MWYNDNAASEHSVENIVEKRGLSPYASQVCSRTVNKPVHVIYTEAANQPPVTLGIVDGL